VRALIFGGTGMLGQAVTRAARGRGWPALALSHAQADVADAAAVEHWARTFAPQLVFNCAAYTQVDACEEQREQAFRVNGEALAGLVAAAGAVGARLVHVSTDYVFDGAARAPYREEDPTAPLGVYGASKLRGEQLALAEPSALVVRTSWLFGPGGGSFVTTMLRLIREGRLPLRVVDDQLGCPTYTPFLAEALCELAARGARGIVHYRNRDEVSWYEFAREIAGQWDLDVAVQPVSTAEFPRPARRPAYSVLAVDRYEALTGRRVEPWGWGLGELLAGWRRTGRLPA
jgi:dTDP-4-dehydrorhamnose reductase